MTEFATGVHSGLEDGPISVTYPNRWKLDADPDAIDKAAESWRTLAKAASDRAELINGRAKKLYDGQWEGETADTYHHHRGKLTGDLENTAGAARQVATTLDGAAADIRTAKYALDDSLEKIKFYDVAASFFDEAVTFSHPDGDGARLPQEIVDKIDDQWHKADDTQRWLNERLFTYSANLTREQSNLKLVSAAWATRSAAPFTMPPEAKGVGVIHDLANHRFVINTGNSSDDKAEVSVDQKTGERAVIINGVRYPVPNGMQITIRTAGGNDTVIGLPPPNPAYEGDDARRVDLTVLAGDGNDEVYTVEGNDRVLAGDGNDFVSTAGGDDRISGNAGADVTIGSSGDDMLRGGDGNDRLQGYGGNDRLSGGDRDDYLTGGLGDDKLSGGAGGKDTLSGDDGRDVVRGEAGDEVIFVSGDKDDINVGGTGEVDRRPYR